MPRPLVRPLTPDDWPAVERLFGERGACGGCWCMHFRVPRGGKHWEEVKGEPNRRALRRLVRSGEAQGCLAFDGDEPIGWVSAGPRADFVRMDNSRVFRTEWDAGAWSVACFFVARGHHGRGVARALLRGAVELARGRGATHLLGYPAPVPAGRERVVPVFAHTGIEPLFARAGFREATPPGTPRPVWIRRFRRRKA